MKTYGEIKLIMDRREPDELIDLIEEMANEIHVLTRTYNQLFEVCRDLQEKEEMK